MNDELTRREFSWAAAAGLAAAITPKTANPQPAAPGEDTLQSMLKAPEGVRLADHTGKEWTQDQLDALKGKTVIVASGFRTCPLCQKINSTVRKSINDIRQKDKLHLVIFNFLPESDFKDREKYIDLYKDMGIDVTILFAKDASTGKPSNDLAESMENSLMNHVGPGHNTSVFVFNGQGKRMSEAGVEATGQNQANKIQELTGQIRQALLPPPAKRIIM